MSYENGKKMDDDVAVWLSLGCWILIIVAFVLLWRFWIWVLPIFSVMIFVYACYKAKRLSTTRKKVCTISGAAIGIGALCASVCMWNWLMPIAVILGVCGCCLVINAERQAKEEEEIRNAKAAKELARQNVVAAKRLAQEKWHKWMRDKYKYIESWFATAYVILDTNVWMSMEYRSGLDVIVNKCVERRLFDYDPNKEISHRSRGYRYFKDDSSTNDVIHWKFDEWASSSAWNLYVDKNSGYALLSILSSSACGNAKVVVPGAQLDELANILRNNPKGSPKWKAAKEAQKRIEHLQKMGCIVMPDVKAQPDRWAYLDAMLVSFLEKFEQDTSASRPVRIVTFDRDLIIRLRAVAAKCEHGGIEIIDKDDLIHLLRAPSMNNM